jgi:hypothetical protein
MSAIADTSTLIRLLQAQERTQLGDLPPPASPEQATIPYTDLAEPLPNSPIGDAWNHYRREVGCLLAEGHEGCWVLIENEEIIGIWDSSEEADKVRVERFLMQPVLVKQILAREPVLRGGGYDRRWTS